jgi:hypothetical protein
LSYLFFLIVQNHQALTFELSTYRLIHRHPHGKQNTHQTI